MLYATSLRPSPTQPLPSKFLPPLPSLSLSAEAKYLSFPCKGDDVTLRKPTEYCDKVSGVESDVDGDVSSC